MDVEGPALKIDLQEPAFTALCASVLEGIPDLQICWSEPLARHTTLRVGGPVACLVRPRTGSSLRELLKATWSAKIPRIILGGGSNVLPPDSPWDVLVIQLTLSNLDLLHCEDLEGDRVRVYAGAGVHLSRLLRFCVENGWGGLEPMVGIPGTVGGALVMNAGTKEGSISQVLSWVDLLDERGNPERIHRSQLPAGYRFMGLPPDRIVTGACLELQRSPVDRIKSRLREIMGQRRRTQPLGWPSAGCVFKNPGNAAAGALIDASGLKGVRWGGAEVSEKHANWIINRGNATRDDILGLILHIEKAVRERFGVRLEREIRVWGE